MGDKYSWMAVVSLTLSVLGSIFVYPLSISRYVFFPLGFLIIVSGIIFGFFALGGIKKIKLKGKWLAIAGIILGFSVIIILTIIFLSIKPVNSFGGLG